MKGRPDDWTRVVRQNWQDLQAYIVTSTHPSCLRMARDEVEHIHRTMQTLLLEDLPRLKPAQHWFMAVIVCPGDDLSPLVTWVQNRDAHRVHFYLHTQADAQALAPWRDAGLPLSRIEEERFTSYGRMHAKLGLDLSDQVYGDFS